MNQHIEEIFGKRIRIRVCGLCLEGDNLLLINHNLYPDQDFWAPPGGGLELGQSAADALIREFMEETSLDIRVKEFRCIAEFINPPFHALELFFEVEKTGGTTQIGHDPELPADKQLIRDIRFMPWAEIQALPDREKHGLLRLCKGPNDLKLLTGFYRI
ncbi:MAG: NUDIX hydrolase [Cyclobacteriaceae bacterium]|nr:NUDIX hydrolase [Cyclobacteriaceae bacterium]